MLGISACIGLAMGSGFYLAAIVGTGLILIVMTVLSKIDQRYKKTILSTNIYIEMADIAAMRDIIRVCKEQGWQIASMEMSKGKQGKNRSLAIMMQLDTLMLTLKAGTLCEEIEKLDDVLFVAQLEAP
jgi:putative Mg2+ transporter-C (MgtC) family protein